MRYSIPKEKETQDQEWKRILRSLTGENARTADQALRFIMDHANGKAQYDPRTSYRTLYGFYVELGLEGRNDIDAFFKGNERNPENFQKEMEKFWRVLEIHSMNPTQSLYNNYKSIKADPGKYDKQLRDAEALEQLEAGPAGMREAEAAPEKAFDDGALPLVNEKSPYYAAVTGTVYEEMFNLWDEIRKYADFRQKGEQLLKEDMEQLLSKMQLHYIRHNRSGSYLPMTAKEHKELQELHGECIKDLTRLSVIDDLKPFCEKLNTILVQNQTQLKGLSPADLPPLASVVRSTKKSVAEFDNRDQNKIGDAMSSREPVEYTDENGVRHRGFFTEEVKEKSERDDLLKILAQYNAKYPRYAKVFDGVYLQYDLFKVAAYYECTQQKPEEGSGGFTLDEFIKASKWMPQNDPHFRRIIGDLAVEVGKNMGRHTVLDQSGIEKGDTVATRACAMTDVAKALGFPDLLAESKRITVKSGNKEVKGVMTEAAGLDMADFAYMSYTDPFYTKMDREQLNSKEMLSSLADLQILDYLCGNTDRHANNFFLKQDYSDPENPKLVGVLGIDNDNSFGTILDGGMLKLASQSDLKIITPKMADAIEKMTSADLSNLLKPYEFRKAQVEAAKTRLAHLKDMVKLGRENPELRIEGGKLKNPKQALHIVQDDEWEKLNLQKLMPEPVYKTDENGDIVKDRYKKPIIVEEPDNIFSIADVDYQEHKQAEHSRKLDDDLKQPHSEGPNKGKAPIRYNEQKQKEPKEFKIRGPEYGLLAYFHRNEAEGLKKIQQKLYDNGGNHLNKRSEEFKEMNSALTKYINSYAELERILQEDTSDKNELKAWRKEGMKQRKLDDFYRKMAAAKKNLDQKIDAYNNRKRRRISARNQQRINAATSLKEILAQKTESMYVYENYLARKKPDDASVNTAQQITNMENQIYGKMHFALRDNLSSHSKTDPVWSLGVKALEAQKRLWNYSMNGANTGNASVKRPEKSDEMSDAQFAKEKFTLETLQKAIQEGKNKNPGIQQVKEDLKTIYRYTLQLKKSGELPEAAANEFLKTISRVQDPGNVIGEQEISSREVRGILHTLYKNELTIANTKQKEIGNEPQAKKENAKQEKIKDTGNQIKVSAK